MLPHQRHGLCLYLLLARELGMYIHVMQVEIVGGSEDDEHLFKTDGIWAQVMRLLEVLFKEFVTRVIQILTAFSQITCEVVIIKMTL